MTSGAKERSGVMISTLAPAVARNSAACRAAWSPASSKIRTLVPGFASPEMMSQADTTSSLPLDSTSVCGSPPVAMMTTSGLSA